MHDRKWLQVVYRLSPVTCMTNLEKRDQRCFVQVKACARCRGDWPTSGHAASSTDASQQLHYFEHPCRCGGAYVISEGARNVPDGMGGACVGLLLPDEWKMVMQRPVKRPCMTALLAAQTRFQRSRMRC